MGLVEVPNFLETRPWGYVGLAIGISLVIAASAFAFSFFLRDLIFELMKRWGIYDINNPQNFSTMRMILVHIGIMIFILAYVISLFLLLRWIFVKRKLTNKKK